MKLFVASVFSVCFACFANAIEKVITWELPNNWANNVSYEKITSGASTYVAIIGEDLSPRAGIADIGDPDLPYVRALIPMPQPGTFVSFSYDVEWEVVDLGSLQPIPVVPPITPGAEALAPAPNTKFSQVYPSEAVSNSGIIIDNGARAVDLRITPFKWDGTEKKLYRATSLKVSATFSVSLGGMQKKSVEKPYCTCPAAEFGNDHDADVIIISPPEFVDLWKAYAAFRKTTKNGTNHTFAVKSTAAIYEEYKIKPDQNEDDDALSIHHYLEHLYSLGKIKYVLLGSGAKKNQYDRQTIVPSRYVVVEKTNKAQVLDAYYGAMYRFPLNANGVETGKEVWDHDGDGIYLGSSVNGIITANDSKNIDWTQSLAVFRFPLRSSIVETNDGTNIVLTAEQMMTNHIEKIKYVEAPNFPGRFHASITGTTIADKFTITRSTTQSTELYEPSVDEREFFDGAYNMFDTRHPEVTAGVEVMGRDRYYEFMTSYRGALSARVHNDRWKSATQEEIYSNDGEYFNIDSHGAPRSCAPGNPTSIMFSTGKYVVYLLPVPCSSGQMDINYGGGITNTLCVGEAPALSPAGGALAAFSNTRQGWFTGMSTSANVGKGAYSIYMDYLLFRTLSGLHNRFGTSGKPGDGTGEIMDVATALKVAKNLYGSHSSGSHWGLSAMQVTGHGDPLARFTPQVARVWNGSGYNWNASDQIWNIEGTDIRVASEVSTEILMDLTSKGDQTFTIESELASAGFNVTQDPLSTMTLTGNGSFKVSREAIITGGNLRWDAAGGVGRYGLKFVGARGDLSLFGDAKRYFGDCFTNIGSIRVGGSNVTIDTPRNAEIGENKNLDFRSLSFVCDNATTPATNNILRARTKDFWGEDFQIPVVNSELIFQTIDAPIISATNSIIRVERNPLFKPCCFDKTITLNNSTLQINYDDFTLGNGETMNLIVQGECRIIGSHQIKINGELNVTFVDENSSLSIETTLIDGENGGKITITDGNGGNLIFTTLQRFTNGIRVGENQTLTCQTDIIFSSITTARGSSVYLTKIPLIELPSLEIVEGAALHLPESTAPSIYSLINPVFGFLRIDENARVYDDENNEIPGKVSQGCYVISDGLLKWNRKSGTWDTSTTSTSWLDSDGNACAYNENVPIIFGDITDKTTGQISANSTVLINGMMSPLFVEFQNSITKYTFTYFGNPNAGITFNSLIINSPVQFDLPVISHGDLLVKGGSLEVSQSARVQTANMNVVGGEVRVRGHRYGSVERKIKKLRFEFVRAQTSSAIVAVNELKLFRGDEFLYLPVGTILRDCANQSVTITGNNGSQGHTMTGSVGNESLSALVDNSSAQNNKWWPSKSQAPTWVEIEFPEPIAGITNYSLKSADTQSRDPKSWNVYAVFEQMEIMNQVAAEVDINKVNQYSMLKKDGSDRFALNLPPGLTVVGPDGVVVLDGAWESDFRFEANATLKVVNADEGGTNCVLRANHNTASVVTPTEGTVLIDVSEIPTRETAFPVFTGFHITESQFRRFASSDNAILELRDGDIYARVPENILKGPYSANINRAAYWESLSFTDNDNNEFNWSSNPVVNSGCEVYLNFEGEGVVSSTEPLNSSIATLIIDASGLDGDELAARATIGAPYSRYLITAPFDGIIKLAATPKLPRGYISKLECIPGRGVRLIVMVNPDASVPLLNAATHGSISVNFAGDRNGISDASASRVSDNNHASKFLGAHPISGAYWNDMPARNGTFTIEKYISDEGKLIETKEISMITSGCNTYDTGREASDPIMRGYIDDRTNVTTVIEFSNIPFEKYRVIVYRATDHANTTYAPLKIGTNPSNALWYYGVNNSDYTVSGENQSSWGDTNANSIKENVNYIISDVLTGGAIDIQSTRNNNMRGCIAAIQIVEVKAMPDYLIVSPDYDGVIEIDNPLKIRVMSELLDGSQVNVFTTFEFLPVEGGYRIAINKDGSYWFQVGDEWQQVPVIPEVDTIEDDEDLEVSPIVETEDGVAIGVKTIPGLIYELMRSTTFGEWEREPISTIRANDFRHKMMDYQKPDGKAFYRIRVKR